MIYRGAELYNVAELERVEGIGGVVLQRYPLAIRNILGRGRRETGRVKSRSASGCEIRFVTDSDTVAVTLTGVETDAAVSVYNGDIFQSVHRLPRGVPTRLELHMPDLSGVTEDFYAKRRFSHRVWRIFIERGMAPSDQYSVALGDIDAFGHEIRPPRPDEVPSVRWLAYGSSITHGTGSTFHHGCNIQQAAARLGVDVLNMAIGGACFCEPEIADFLASLDWDFATLELGVNMRTLFTPEEFESRARNLVRRCLTARPGAPVALITVYPNADDFASDAHSERAAANRTFREILRKIHRGSGCRDLYLIEGRDILTEIDGLSFDRIHPSDYGHAIMGQHLAEKLSAILRGYGLPQR